MPPSTRPSEIVSAVSAAQPLEQLGEQDWYADPLVQTDLAIVGAGPIGLYATFYAGMRELRVMLIDSLSVLGGQLPTLYPESLLYDAPGHPAVHARELSDALVRQAQLARPDIRLNCTVTHIDGGLDGFTLTTSRGVCHAKAVLIAAGVGAMRPRVPAGVNLERLGRDGIYHTVPPADACAHRRVMIVGSSREAERTALRLTKIGARVDFANPQQTAGSANPEGDDLQQAGVVVHPRSEIVAIADEKSVRHVTVRHLDTLDTSEVPADIVVFQLGYESTLAPIAGWGLTLERNAIRVDHAMETTRRGIFAAGDVCTYPGKLKLLATGFAEAAMAVNQIKTRLDPTANLFPGHSTTVAPRRLSALREHGGTAV